MDAPPKRLYGDLLQQYDCTTPTPAAVRWRQRSRQRGRTPAASRNGKLLLPQLDRLHLAFKRRQVSLSVLQPVRPGSPEDRHPYPKACHGAAHQALGALQGPASALRRHAFRGAAPASHATETQSHGPGLHPARGDEQPRGAGRQRQGTRARLEAPLMARRHQAHLPACLRPSALGSRRTTGW